ncbi:hypothetical protein IF650_01810 [Cellulosimicrobium terreum]|nr:hypothetical protein [Cellulosimicrobium terreum]
MPSGCRRLVFDARDPRALSTFWKAVLGYVPRSFFQQVPEEKVAKNRVHLDVRTASDLRGDERMAALEARCEELVALGATRQQRFEPELPTSIGWIVMADPEGNEFCLD